MPETSSPPPADANASSPLQLVFSWLFVGIPLAWGVWEVAAKSLDLFTK